MSNMVINTNVLALNSHRALKIAGTTQSKSSTRLSTGLKINSAADDAAGLSISEKMRAQVRGLDMASKNSQDAISLIQTAEGGMQEIDNMVQRIRELTVQSSNDTNEHNTLGSGDRQKMQDEVNQLVEEIDSMAERVEFNKKKVINGDYSSDSSEVAVAKSALLDAKSVAAKATKTQAEALKSFEVADANKTAARNTYVNLMATGGSFVTAATTYGKHTATSEGIATDSSVTIHTSNLIVHSATADVAGAMSAYRSLQISNNAVANSAVTGVATIVASTVSSNAVGFAEFVRDTGITGTADFLALLKPTAALTANGIGIVANTVNATVNAIENYDAKIIFASGAAGLAKLRTLSEYEPTAITDATATTMIAEAKKIITAYDAVNNSKNGGAFDVATKIYNNAVENRQLMKDTFNAAAKQDAVARSAQTIANAKVTTANNKVSAKETSLISAQAIAEVAGKNEGLYFQVGANANQGLDMNIGSLKSDLLGIGDGKGTSKINFLKDTGRDITETLDTLDTALSYVTTERSRLGAAQNRLEYTIKSLDVSSENLSAAESRIRDTDMAKEMMSLTKSNVLQQAATSMLAQANQAPQSVLKLLQ